ncbi:MAG: tRNA 2-thiouridine(34) synthase MnmA [Clostridia bacterium]|nr:tRNA 2-thiouridine(34) synthase MnmA [Clostridia bacterium]
MKKALVAMSGGVDSSLALALTLDEGYECAAVTMRLHHYKDNGLVPVGVCGSAEDVADAKAVAQSVGVSHEVLDFTADFSEKIVDPFIASYERGDTPNPCIECNRYMKFEKLMEAAKARGCEAIVTGHYARVEKDEATGRMLLKKAVAAAKDQSYVLYFLTQEQLSSVRFPLGWYESKDEVRKEAAARGFSTAKKGDSQDICFVPDGDYASFIEKRTGKAYPIGNFIDVDGKILGKHQGLIRYTIGQRKGLGIALGEPMYVKEKNVAENTVTLARNDQLFSRSFIMDHVNLIDREKMTGPTHLSVKPRYKAIEAPALVTPLADGRYLVEFDEPQRALTTGQAAVMYNGDVVVGGGTIVFVCK